MSLPAPVAEPAEPEFDKDAEPLGLTGQADTDEQRRIRELLWSLNQVDAGRAALDEQRKDLLKDAVPLLKKIGRPVMITNPVTGKVTVAAPREDEVLVVPATSLYRELLAHFKAEGYSEAEAAEETETIWQSVLKPPAVDTKEGGLFKQAVDAGKIPGHVVAKVASFSKKAAFVGFTEPKRQ